MRACMLIIARARYISFVLQTCTYWLTNNALSFVQFLIPLTVSPCKCGNDYCGRYRDGHGSITTPEIY